MVWLLDNYNSRVNSSNAGLGACYFAPVQGLPAHCLVAHYPFNGNAGTVYSFDGNDDCIDVYDAVILNPTQAIGVAAWFNLHSFSTPNPPVVKKSWEPTSQAGVFAQMHGYALECRFDLRGFDGVYGTGVKH